MGEQTSYNLKLTKFGILGILKPKVNNSQSALPISAACRDHLTYSLGTACIVRGRLLALLTVEERVSHWSRRATCCWVRRPSSHRTLSSSCTRHTANMATCSQYVLSTSTSPSSWTHTAMRPCRERRTSTSTPFRNRLLTYLFNHRDRGRYL